jgi:hypothetical protein
VCEVDKEHREEFKCRCGPDFYSEDCVKGQTCKVLRTSPGRSDAGGFEYGECEGEGFRTEIPDPFAPDGIENCGVSEDGKLCKCPHPVDPEVSTECNSHKYCNFDTGKCIPDCAENLPGQCKCGEGYDGNDVVCKKPGLCDNDTGRSDIPIVSCDDDTDGSPGQV